jgi:hypothetical protein
LFEDFTEKELDFIINYDVKYWMGKELDGGEGEQLYYNLNL